MNDIQHSEAGSYRKPIWIALCIVVTVALVSACASPGMQASAGSAATATPASGASGQDSPAQTRVIGAANNGSTVQLSIGERFALNLGEGPNWNVEVADQAIVSRVIGILTVKGVQGIYEVHAAGQTTLVATPDNGGQPFRVTLVVQ